MTKTLASVNFRFKLPAMNIPVEIARAQGVHGFKGGRPRLNLTDKERSERRQLQHEAYRRRKGVPPRVAGRGWGQDYYDIWGKAPGQPLTTDEFAIREPIWNAWVAARI